MHQTKSETGFTLVEGLLIILIVTILGFGGYYVWSNQSENTDTKSKKTTATKQEADDSKNSWYLYEDPSKQYAINLPDGWKFDHMQDSGMLYAPNSNMKDQPGVPAVVNESKGQYGIGTGLSLTVLELQDSDYALGEESLEEFKTKQNLTVKPFYREMTEEGDMSYEKGTKIYSYYIFDPNFRYVFEYSYGPNDTDQRSTVEKSIKTLHIYQ